MKITDSNSETKWHRNAAVWPFLG